MTPPEALGYTLLTMDLTVQTREILGRKVSSLRGENLIPAELYGHGIENIHLTVPAKEFSKVFKQAGENTVVKLKIGKDEINVLIYDIQKNSLTDKITHVDFYAVKMDEKITTSIPLEFIGEAPAVKEKQGVLIKSMQELEIKALPADLPRNFEVELGKLSEIGMSIYVSDLRIPKGVEVLVNPETVIATIIEQAKEEVEEKPISVEEVKVEGEEKKKEAETAETAETKETK